jgi:hypothetical protein
MCTTTTAAAAAKNASFQGSWEKERREGKEGKSFAMVFGDSFMAMDDQRSLNEGEEKREEEGVIVRRD